MFRDWPHRFLPGNPAAPWDERHERARHRKEKTWGAVSSAAGRVSGKVEDKRRFQIGLNIALEVFVRGNMLSGVVEGRKHAEFDRFDKVEGIAKFNRRQGMKMPGNRSATQ